MIKKLGQSHEKSEAIMGKRSHEPMGSSADFKSPLTY
jgi:hypothetical protein